MSQRHKTDTWTFREKLLALCIQNAAYKPQNTRFYKLHVIM